MKDDTDMLLRAFIKASGYSINTVVEMVDTVTGGHTMQMHSRKKVIIGYEVTKIGGAIDE